VKRLILPAILGFIGGCGGAQETSKPSSDPTPVVAASQATPAPVASAPTNDAPAKSSKVKGADEPPGLVLPDADTDTVGAKPPELPIR